MTGSHHLTSYGPWALVTGASSGIGAEVARGLAAAGLDVVLAARGRDALEVLAAELAATHGVRTRVVVVDLATDDGPSELDEATQDLDVGMVVANAGTGRSGGFLHHRIDDELGDLRLNVTAPTVLAHRFGRRLAARAARGDAAALVLTGSVAAYQGVANMATYTAAKAYVMTLGEALHAELALHGVDVTVVAPGPTTTPMAEAMQLAGADRVRWMTAADVADEALAAVGRRATVVVGRSNRLLVWVTRHLMSRRRASTLLGETLSGGFSAETRAGAPLPSATGPTATGPTARHAS